MRTSTRKQIMLMAVLALLPMAACAISSIDKVLIPHDARDVQKHSFAGGKIRNVSYIVDLTYPATALTDAHFVQLKKLGWSKCSGYREGWESHVDASRGEGRDRSVFQNFSYWYKGDTLLTVIMSYDSDLTGSVHCLKPPDNTRQSVSLIEGSNLSAKDGLGITCP